MIKLTFWALLLSILSTLLSVSQEEDERWLLKLISNAEVRFRADVRSGVVRTLSSGSVVEATDRWLSSDGHLSYKLTEGWISLGKG